MQAGFRAQRSYEDQVMRLSQSIHDGFQCPKPAKRTVVALLDFSKAYDKVWQADVLRTMLDKGIPPRFVRWIKGFLTNRQARVRFQGELSETRHFREGVPQGSVLAPILFLFAIDGLNARLPLGIEISLFADDVALWASRAGRSGVPHSGLDEANKVVERGVQEVYRWSREKKLDLNLKKCQVGFFSPHTKEFSAWRPNVCVGGTTIAFRENPEFLGVVYDRLLCFSEQVKKAAGKLVKGSQMCAALSCTA